MTTGKEQVSFRVDAAVLKRVRLAVLHNRGAPHFLTLDGVVQDALDRAATKLERDNGGKPYDAPRKK